MLVGISTRVGPGGGLIASRKARRTSAAIVDQSRTRLVNLENVRQISAPYASWNEPSWSSVVGCCPARQTTGLPVKPATHRPVTALVSPPPAVTGSKAGRAARKLPRAGPGARILAARRLLEQALEALDRPLGARGGRLRARRGGFGPRRGLLGPARRRVVGVRPPGQRDQQRGGGARPPAHRVTLGGRPGSRGGCGERSGGARRQPRCQMAARFSLLRRPTPGARPARRTSSVVAALPPLAPRLVRLARHGSRTDS